MNTLARTDMLDRATSRLFELSASRGTLGKFKGSTVSNEYRDNTFVRFLMLQFVLGCQDEVLVAGCVQLKSIAGSDRGTKSSSMSYNEGCVVKSYQKKDNISNYR